MVLVVSTHKRVKGRKRHILVDHLDYRLPIVSSR